MVANVYLESIILNGIIHCADPPDAGNRIALVGFHGNPIPIGYITSLYNEDAIQKVIFDNTHVYRSTLFMLKADRLTLDKRKLEYSCQ
jgi:hypothetical protein